METFTTKEVQLGLFKNQDITGHPDQERMVYFNQTFGEPKNISLNVDKVQKPQETRYFDYTNNSQIGVFLGRKIIDRRYVYNTKSKNDLRNFIREGSTINTTHSEKLASFIYMNDYNHGEWPSVVFKLKTPLKIDGKTYFYILGSAGHHREESLDILGAGFWMYDIYEEMPSQDSWVLDDAIIQDNGRLQAPQLDLTKYAVENKLTEMVKSKRWKGLLGEDLVDEIKKYLGFTVPNIHHNTRAAMARNAVRKTHSTDWVDYTPEEADKFIDTNTDFKHSGEYDETREEYGWTIMDGYFDKRFFQALMKFEETGRESYAIGYGKTPKLKNGDNRCIRDVKTEQFEKIQKRIENGLDKIFEFKKSHGRYPKLAVNGIVNYLPQDRKTENLNKVV